MNGEYWYKEEKGSHHGLYDIEDYPLMQFTGLKDKNGKEIYEGDILKNTFGELNEVRWWDGTFVLGRDGINILNQFTDIEVIGNIWEHPELLK